MIVPPLRLCLASASPRRRELLRALRVEFICRPADVDETPHPGEPPADYVDRLARAKAEAQADRGELVLAADTTVVIEDRILGKPRDAADARDMLRLLSGSEHVVLTGVALCAEGRNTWSKVVASRVEIAPMTTTEIDWYLTTGEPFDKAGGYAIQGYGALYVNRVHGNYTNVVGLPLPAVYRLFQEAGYDLRSWFDGD